MNNETSGFDELEAHSQNRPSMVINAPISISSLTCKHNEEEASLFTASDLIPYAPNKTTRVGGNLLSWI